MPKGSYAKADWQRLGEALIRRRVQMDPRYRNLSRFARERGMEYRILWDLEKGARDNYQTTTLIATEVAYGLRFGSIRDLLEGGDITPDGFTPRQEQVLDAAPEAFRRLAAGQDTNGGEAGGKTA